MVASRERFEDPDRPTGSCRRHQTRSRVVAAARTAFAELGCAATTYRLLAERTGPAPSALYNYFRSKAALYAAVHAEVQRETYSEWIEPARASADTFAGQVDAILASLVAMNFHDPEAADADLHRTAVEAFRSALTTLLISTADQP